MVRVALVAGASSGLGRAVAARLAASGFRTYAGARSFGSANAGKTPPEGCVPVSLDVTDDESVGAAVAKVLAAEGRIDALVNCAGFLTLGSCEETSIEELRAVLSTNLLGMARVTQAVLPVMRGQGGGRIVQFSSINGLLAIPFQGAYIASKHAVEGWSEALAMETRSFGVSVTIVEPGDCRSGSDAYRGHAAASSNEASAYRGDFLAATGRIRRDEQGGMDPDRVARAVVRVLAKRRPPMRALVARLDQRLAVWLHDLLPGRLFACVIRAYYGLSNSKERKKKSTK